MKVIVVGCTHAGTAAIVNTKKLYPEAEVVVYERNNTVSFLSCGIALSVGGVVSNPEKLFYNSPQGLEALGVATYMEHDVLAIDFKNKTIRVKDLKTQEIKQDTYDKLILTLGSWPIVPSIPGGDQENIVLCKNYNHAQAIIEKTKEAKKIVVVGAGYIGVELAEAFQMKGKEVTLIDAQERIMSKYLDKEITDLAEKAFTTHAIHLALGEEVESFKGEGGKVKEVVTTKGSYPADLVILCIGFKPNTALVKESLETLPNGAIVIDDYMRTSEPDVFAAGDCCMVRYNPAEDKRYIPLATNAVRMGTLIAYNLVEPRLKYMGTQGTSGIKIYQFNIASTGLTEEEAKEINKYEVASAVIEENYRPEFMPTYEKATVKLVYDKQTRRILGGQIASAYDLNEIMNTLSLALQNKMTVEELAMVDFFFQPHFNKPWGLLNQVALKALSE
ncbi:NADH oxidase [Sporanaerobium hydrogeniformans]|uniref:NADH oxidase n=2 Tax=Sporanaerobium hydrogeniformans TaxID=3072179 RepID=A0AC61DHQ9_9FIRM|nr:NADH oxidase [Sporanaerobium hydrogeniformans]